METNKGKHNQQEYQFAPVEIEIRENLTGKAAKCNWVLRHYHGEALPNFFNWSENNFSCDCNRVMFFSEAMGIEEPEDYPCSDGNFSVRIRLKDTNEIIYDEF